MSHVTRTHTNESCYAYTYEWVTSHVHTRMSHVTHTHMNESCHTYTHEWVMSRIHIWMSHATRTHTNESCHAYTYEWVTSHVHVWMSHVTHAHMNESCHTYECVTHTHWNRTWTGMHAAPWRAAPCAMYCIPSLVTRWVGSWNLKVSSVEYSLFYRALLQKRPVLLRSLLVVATSYEIAKSHLNESCHTYEWVMSHIHIWMRHVTSTNASHIRIEIGQGHGYPLRLVRCSVSEVMVHIHIRMGHVIRMNESHKQVSRVTNTNESCRIYEWVMSHTRMSHISK